MRIKELKTQPLLSPPAPKEWRQVTDKDAEAMIRALNVFRVANGTPDTRGLYVAELHFLTHTLGIGETHTRADLELMERDLKKARREGNGKEVGEILLAYRALGIRSTVEEADRSTMREGLGKLRVGKDPYNLTILHGIMHGLGVGEAVTRQDRGMMEAERLKLLETEKNGVALGLVLVAIRDAKGGKPANPDEINLMRADLEAVRTSGHGFHIAYIHYALHELLPPIQAPSTPPIPPIKRFKN